MPASSLLPFLSSRPPPPPPPPPLLHLPPVRVCPAQLRFRLRRGGLAAAGRGGHGKHQTPLPSDDEPPEAAEDSSHGLSRLDQFARHVDRARRRQAADELGPDHPLFSTPQPQSKPPPLAAGAEEDEDDLFRDIDRAIAEKREEFAKRGLLLKTPSPPPPPPPSEAGAAASTSTAKVSPDADATDDLSSEEVLDLDEIRELQGLTVISESPNDEDDDDDDLSSAASPPRPPEADATDPFDFDVDELGRSRPRILQPSFRMTLAELLDDSKLVPISVYGDLEVSVAGIQHDSSQVNVGDLFVCADGLAAQLTEADKRGAIAVVADKEINIDEALACKALVIVDDVTAALRVLAACFYKQPSESVAVIGIAGTDGVTATVHLTKAMYEAMGVRTGMMGVLGHYVHGDNKLDATPDVAGDPVAVQKLMATMVHNGTEAVVMETPSDGADTEIDYDIAVFTNLRYDDAEVGMTQEEYMNSKARLFAKMTDPERHRKVVNIDDPNAPYFVAQGSPDVLVVSYAMENTNADVHTLKHKLSLFETEVLVQTPQGILEISSGLLGRDNIYNILAAVAVGIAVGAPLEDIVRGIEEVDAIPGRCELIDEEQAFGVIVDHARTPDALSRLLDGVRELGPYRIITVFGCCGERERGKRPLMTKIAAEKSDVVMLTSDNPGNEDPLDILDDMLAGVGWTMQDYLRHGENDYYPPLPNGHRIFLHDIRRVAVRAAVAMGEQGDVVVVAGKGNDTYQIEGVKTEFFDDREECREALHYVDELHQAGIDTTEFPWRLPESH